MNEKILAILIVILAGSFFIIGFIISKVFKNKNKIIDFILGVAFIVTVGLVFLEILPEFFHLFNNKINIGWFIAFIGIGFVLTKILDLIIPNHDHHHDSNEKNIKDHDNHIEHIGIISTLSLIIHNLVEGALIYSSALIDLKIGLAIALSVALHNIPLAIQISSSIKEKSKSLLIAFLLLLSMPLGAIIFSLLNIINYEILALLMGLATGMLLYLAIFELLKEIISNCNKKRSMYGMLLGIVLIIISKLLHTH